MKKKYILPISIFVIIVFGIGFLIYNSLKPSYLDGFAKCIKEKQAVFYGAFWCPHCQSQKTLFGNAKKHLPYVECSTADGNGQLQICSQKNIQNYPTWEFADGSREMGELSLEKLSEKTSCPLPNK